MFLNTKAFSKKNVFYNIFLDIHQEKVGQNDIKC